eukprot:1149430-Pelagomonas_calceolata.AAC.10
MGQEPIPLHTPPLRASQHKQGRFAQPHWQQEQHGQQQSEEGSGEEVSFQWQQGSMEMGAWRRKCG